MIITDRNGVQLEKVIIITICPIAHAAEAKQHCADFLNNGESPELMLNKIVGPIGSNTATHVYCERATWHTEIKKQSDYMTMLNLPWMDSTVYNPESFDITKMTTIVIDENDNGLSILGLEVIA